MSKQKLKKRTNKELVGAILDLNQKVRDAIEYTNHVDKIFGLYLDFEKKRELFTKFIDKKVEEEKAKEAKEQNEQEANGKANPENIPADPKDEGSGAEGIREK